MPHVLQFLVLTVAGWVNRHQEDLIDYLREENRVLREQLGCRPLRLTDAQRRRLDVRGKKLRRRILTQVAGIVTPDTILHPRPRTQGSLTWRFRASDRGRRLTPAIGRADTAGTKRRREDITERRPLRRIDDNSHQIPPTEGCKILRCQGAVTARHHPRVLTPV